MAIPRFNSKINQISVPTMKDFEYEQNRSIYETLKMAGERISDTYFKFVKDSYNEEKQNRQNREFFDRKMEMKKVANIDNPNLTR